MFISLKSFSFAESWRQFSASYAAISSRLPGNSLTRQDKLFYLIDWHRLTLVPYESHTPSRLACGVGIGLSSFDGQSFSRRTDTGFIWRDTGSNGVLACRQVTNVDIALGKASHILDID